MTAIRSVERDKSLLVAESNITRDALPVPLRSTEYTRVRLDVIRALELMNLGSALGGAIIPQ